MGTVDKLATKIHMSMVNSWPTVSWKNCLNQLLVDRRNLNTKKRLYIFYCPKS